MASSRFDSLRHPFCCLLIQAALLLPLTGSATNSVVAFGLTFVSREGTTLTLDQNNFPVVQPAEPSLEGPGSTYGVTILLDQADAGLFGNPNADFETEAFALEGEAYGSLNGVPDQRLSWVRGRRNGYAFYELEADLEALGPASLTYMLFDGNRLIAEVTNAEPGMVTADFCNTSSATPRVNPFWRMPCGSVGVLIEFDSTAEIRLPGPGRTDEEGGGDGYGNRIFIRVDNPSNTVEYVSRVEAWTDSSAVDSFLFTDARPGVFGRGHKALGPARLAPAVGSLTLNNLAWDDQLEDTPGVAIELNEGTAFAGPGEVNPMEGAGRFAVETLPVQVATDGALLELGLMGILNNARLDIGAVAGAIQLVNEEGSLRIETSLPGNGVRLEAYEQGVPVGAALLPHFNSRIEVAGSPAVVACGAAANAIGSPPGYFFRFDQPTTFTAADGILLTGDEIHTQAVELSDDATNGVRITSLQTFILKAVGVSPVTITQETEQAIQLPALTIEQDGDYVIVSWVDPNQIFLLESAPSVDGPFWTVPDEIAWVDNISSVRVDMRTTPTQVFRLSTQRRVRHVD